MDRCIKFSFFLLFLFLLIIKKVNSEQKSYGKEILENEEFEEALKLLEPKSVYENHRKLYGIFNNDSTATNKTCTRDIAALNGAIIGKKLWALQMLDSSSKIPSGLLQGNIIDLGMYDECIAAKGQYLGIEIEGRHCMYSMNFTSGNVSLPILPTLSICVPKSCTAEDIKDVLNGTIRIINKLKNIGITISSVTCATVDQKVWDTEFTLWTLILGSLIVFLIISSLCDVLIQRSPAGAYQHSVILNLSQFSIQKNASMILSLETKPESISVLNGLRVLSMGWVILGHEFFDQLVTVTVNGVDYLPWIQSWNSLYILNGPYAVDTFFTISGFLVTYIFLKQISRQKNFNIFLYYLHRLIRLSPAVIGLVIICIVYVPKIGSGPWWDVVMNFYITNCRKNPWPTLLYVQNFINTDESCLGHLWYLSVDTQLFWISPFILYPLYKKPKIGLTILTLLFIASIATPAYIIGIYKYKVFSSFQDQNLNETQTMFTDVYEKTYIRATPWLIGIFLGYEVACNNRILGKKIIYIGWLTATTAFLFCFLGTRIFTDPNYVYNPIWETFFAVIGKPAWAIGISWICYASIHNCAGPLSSFLSWKFFLPLSRLSYSIYLVHFVILAVRIAAMRTPTYFSSWNIWHIFLGDLIISVVVAFIFCLVFESPAITFEKILFSGRKRSNIDTQTGFLSNGDRSDEERIINGE